MFLNGFTRVLISHALDIRPTWSATFMRDEIEKKRSLIKMQKSNYRTLWSHVRTILSFFDLLRFCCYIAKIDNVKEKENLSKNERNLRLLRLQRFGNTANPDKKNITNLSDYKLSPTEEFVLSHGLNFCLPPTNPKREGIFAEFEVLLAQLQHHRPQTPEKHSALKAKLSDLAHAYCGTFVDAGDFLMHRECLSAIKSLRSNSNILITKPDKGSGVVILNKTDFIKKMNSILENETKFLTLGPSSEKDNTSKIECRIQRRLLQLHKDDLLPANLYDLIRPTGSQRPRNHACTAFPKHTKKMCHSDPFCLWPVQHNTSWPKISLLFSNLFSLSVRATAYETLSPLQTSLKLQIWTLLPSFSALSTFRVYLLMSLQRWLFKSVLMLSIVRNTLLHLFHGKSSSNLWRWLLLVLSLASMTSCIAKSTESPWDHLLDQPLPIFLLATMNLNFFRPLRNRRCITAIWMTLS